MKKINHAIFAILLIVGLWLVNYGISVGSFTGASLVIMGLLVLIVNMCHVISAKDY